MIDRLESLLRDTDVRRPAPVEAWDPPYCGDIGLKITHDGVWHYRGSPIARQGLVRLFARVLRRDADGRTYLVTPAEKIFIDVEDAPFLAVEMAARGSGREQMLAFRTNVDDGVTCGADHPLRFAEAADGGLKPYVHVRGRLEALLARPLVYDLVELAAEGPDGRPGLWSAGAFFALPG